MTEDKIAQVVGLGNMDRSQATLDAFAQDMSLVSRGRPVCVVKVNNSEEALKLIKVAQETQTPLVPVSSGPPHFRGDTVPTSGVAIIVDLSGMNRIIHISRKHRMVMFEPGVTFSELIKSVAKEGMRLNMPLSPRRSKSVLGSLLEREPVVMPIYHWDIGDPIGCMEIVFGNGELFRTGAAADSGTIGEQWAAGGSQKEAAGPSSSSWYRLIQGSQRTMGIVTWVTSRLEISPEKEKPFLIGSYSLDKVTDALHWLIRLRLVNECLVLNNVNVSALMAQTGVEFQSLKEGLPPWILFFNIAAYNYFPEERIQEQIKDMLEITQKVGVEPVNVLGQLSAKDFLAALKHPSVEPYWKIRQEGNCQDLFFITIYKKLNEQIKVMYDVADEVGFPVSNLGIYLQPIVQGVNCHCEFNLFYNPQNSTDIEKVEKLSALATRRLIEKGAFFSRPYGENTEIIMNRDAATVDALKKIKSIADPQNIMNPGKLCF